MIVNQEISINAVKGLFILFLVIVANFLGTTLNCKVQKRLEHSIITRNIAIFFLIYFTINFYSEPENHLLDQMISTILIYFLFVFLMKQNEYFFILNLILIVVIFMVSQSKNFYQSHSKKQRAKELEKTIAILKIIFLLSLFIGFIIYLRSEIAVEKNNFNFIHFMFGNKVCN
jgi:hypothetical protein